jgi:hypothetical protein
MLPRQVTATVPVRPELYRRHQCALLVASLSEDQNFTVTNLNV